ncbi:MAG: hypothetical protein LBC27_04340 [Spirochaetaceae bacterium]|nr:hypothetical protein [Spirochaetaceae bacterium]
MRSSWFLSLPFKKQVIYDDFNSRRRSGSLTYTFLKIYYIIVEIKNE